MSKKDNPPDLPLNVLVEYKKGNLTFEEAIKKFSISTGVDQDVAEECVKRITKENVIKLSQIRNIIKNSNKPSDHSLTVLVDYKKGTLTFEEAVQKFSFFTGVGRDVAEEFVKKITKENVIK